MSSLNWDRAKAARPSTDTRQTSKLDRAADKLLGQITEPGGKKVSLTAKQAEMLRRIVATNGGGVFAGFHEMNGETATIRRLEALGLAQGKAGDLGRAVHTRAGLKWVKENPA